MSNAAESRTAATTYLLEDAMSERDPFTGRLEFHA